MSPTSPEPAERASDRSPGREPWGSRPHSGKPAEQATEVRPLLSAPPRAHAVLPWRTQGSRPGLRSLAHPAGSGGVALHAVVLALSTCLLAAGEPDWPHHRGSAALDGRSAARVGDAPKQRWAFKTDGPIKGSPVVADGIVVIGSGDQNLYGLDLATGAKRWALAAGSEIEASAAIVDLPGGGRLAVVGTLAGTVIAVDPATGVKRWEHTCEDKVIGAANAFGHAGERRLLVGSYDGKVHCLDAATGKPRWAYGIGNPINGTPAVTMVEGREVTVVGGCDGNLHVVALADGSVVRQIEAGAYVAASPACDGAQAYVGHYGNEVIAVDLAAGKLLWTYKDRSFPYYSSPAIDGGRVYLGGRDRRVHAIARKDGVAAWTHQARADVDGSPLLCGDRLLAASNDGRLYCLDAASGAQKWAYEIGGKLGGTPAVAGGLIVIGCEDGSLYALATTEGGAHGK